MEAALLAVSAAMLGVLLSVAGLQVVAGALGLSIACAGIIGAAQCSDPARIAR